jgi:hypothetical protein
VRIGVPAESLDEYIAAFYPRAANLQGLENVVSEYVGSIAVLVNGPETVTTFDFMPLLTLCTHAKLEVYFSPWLQQTTDPSQVKFIDDLNSLLQNWIADPGAKPEDTDDDDDVDMDVSDADDPNCEDENGEEEEFPALTHAFVQLYHEPAVRTREPYCHAKIEFVLPKYDSRYWADGKSLYEFREAERWSWSWTPTERDAEVLKFWKCTPCCEMSARRPNQWDILARVAEDEDEETGGGGDVMDFRDERW